MKMAELNDPAMVCAEFYNSGNLVGDRSPDPSVYRGGNRCECVRPTPHVLSAWLEHRIEKDGAILMARLERHHIQNPIFPSKSEIKSVQEQNQRSSWQAQFPRSRYELPQRSTKPPTQPLRGKAIAWSESFQCASVHKHCLHRSRTRSLRLAATPFLADSPRSLALTALTTLRTEVINLGSATRGISRAMNACTRTTHRLTGKVSKNTEKFRLAFNQISLSEPNVQPWEVRTRTVSIRYSLRWPSSARMDSTRAPRAR